ncbi:MAG: Phosphoribosylformylglycinamidine synthase, glutamine amidotransferase subunit, partial [uncultured Nocardioidaceae bacterium]
EDRHCHLPRFPRRRRRGARRTHRRRGAGRALARSARPRRRRRRHPARRLLVRRLPARRSDRPLRAGDDRGDRGRVPWPACPGHLQRLPDPLRVPPAAR